ncbi:MAG: ethanolamine ammonia-lyase reactivating factor EutA [Oscillospiraceae bacterium]|nr:ethanolamine ammonia-lyase reactivating factor EutA [Oscillospiraceae bacterium]
MAQQQSILSVGIDLGTSTTSFVVSRLSVDDTASYFSVPRVAITGKEIVYKSEVHETPLVDRWRIDGAAVRRLLEDEYRRAGLRPADIATGAVIITGETARKENAAEVLAQLSSLAGEFVVSTAGPDLEAIIAGKGSGAWQYSIDEATTAANLDIGGGTTNIVLFRAGETLAKGCVDIGGRQVRVDRDGRVTYMSESAKRIARARGVDVAEGQRPAPAALARLCGEMAYLLEQLVRGERTALLEEVTTAGSTPYAPPALPRAVFFSGGVADGIYARRDDLFAYGDIGLLLGAEIRKGGFFRDYRVLQGSETIRATVVGAGSYTTTLSGSTIFYSADIFPMKNVPVLRLTPEEQERCFEGESAGLEAKLRWFAGETDDGRVVLAIRGTNSPSYRQLTLLAQSVAGAAGALPAGAPLILSVESDMAKALGGAVFRGIAGARPVVCIDTVQLDDGDYVDLGRPLMDGLVIPVVVKTLIFG